MRWRKNLKSLKWEDDLYKLAKDEALKSKMEKPVAGLARFELPNELNNKYASDARIGRTQVISPSSKPKRFYNPSHHTNFYDATAIAYRANTSGRLPSFHYVQIFAKYKVN